MAIAKKIWAYKLKQNTVKGLLQEIIDGYVLGWSHGSTSVSFDYDLNSPRYGISAIDSEMLIAALESVKDDYGVEIEWVEIERDRYGITVMFK